MDHRVAELLDARSPSIFRFDLFTSVDRTRCSIDKGRQVTNGTDRQRADTGSAAVLLGNRLHSNATIPLEGLSASLQHGLTLHAYAHAH